MITRSELAQLYTPIYDHFMLQQFGEYDQACYEGFTVEEDNSKQVKVDDLSGLGTWDETNEAAEGDTEDPVQGYPKTYTHLKYTKTMQASFEAVDDDEYALLKKVSVAKNMGRGARDRVERQTSAVLYDGFSTAGPDSQYLYDTDHPKNSEETGTTYDNLLSGAFSHDTLEDTETQITNNLFTMDGIPLPPTKDIVLYHPPALRGPVARVLRERAGERPGTTMRDINRFVGKGTTYKYKPVEWIYLSSKLGGSDTAWYLLFKEFEYFKLIWRMRPHYASWVDEGKDLYNFKGRMRLSTGYDNWRGSFASTGA